MNICSESNEAREKQVATILAVGSEHQKRLFRDKLSGEANFAISLHVRSAPADHQAARLALTVILLIFHSHRSAIIGSNFVARRAGM